MRIFFVLFVTLFTLLLTACGGGSEGKTLEQIGDEREIEIAECVGVDSASVLQNRQKIALTYTDTTAPELTFYGESPLTIIQGDPYVRECALGIDDHDGQVTVYIVDDHVDTSTVGTYIVTFSAVDLAGNLATLERTINVVPIGASYTIGGTASGITADVVLQNNGADDLMVSSDGDFTFASELADGSSYNVSILSQPSEQSCTLTNNVGTVNGANIADISLACTPKSYQISATALTDSNPTITNKSITLDLNSTQTNLELLTLQENSSSAFTESWYAGEPYSISMTNIISDYRRFKFKVGTELTSTAEGNISANDLALTIVPTYRVDGFITNPYKLSFNITDNINHVTSATAYQATHYIMPRDLEYGDEYNLTIENTSLLFTCHFSSNYTDTIHGYYNENTVEFLHIECF